MPNTHVFTGADASVTLAGPPKTIPGGLVAHTALRSWNAWTTLFTNAGTPLQSTTGTLNIDLSNNPGIQWVLLPSINDLDKFASILISEALNLSGGNRSKAAKLLGLSRPTLHARIEKYGLKFETSVKE